MLRFVLLGLAVLAASLSALPDGRAEPPADGGEAAHSGDVAGRLLALHNRERALAGATPLEWDAGLARAAAAYGAELARRGRLISSPLASRPLQGENLWMGQQGDQSVDQGIAAWAAEKRLFKPGRFPDVSTTGEWRDVAHYTQMIWPGTSRVGCALAHAPEKDVLVCYYAPGGNVVGHLML